jgi:hypothetical protein
MFHHSLNDCSGIWLGSRDACRQAVTILLLCCPNAKVKGLPSIHQMQIKAASRRWIAAPLLIMATRVTSAAV